MKRRNDGHDPEGRTPGFWLYPADLERDLKPLSFETQGIWIRMLLAMHWTSRRGCLVHPTGAAMTDEEIARSIGADPKRFAKARAEMERAGTFSRDESGAIFNRRMVRDTDISMKRRAAGMASAASQGKAARRQDGTFASNLLEQNAEQKTDELEILHKQNANLLIQNRSKHPVSSYSYSDSSEIIFPDKQNSTPAKPPNFDPENADRRIGEIIRRHPRERQNPAAVREWFLENLPGAADPGAVLSAVENWQERHLASTAPQFVKSIVKALRDGDWMAGPSPQPVDRDSAAELLEATRRRDEREQAEMTAKGFVRDAHGEWRRAS